MPLRAATWIVSLFEQASQIGGCGFCNDLGMTLRAGIEKNSPSKPGYGVIAIMLAVCSVASAHISFFCAASTLKPSSSARDAEDPVPHSRAAAGDKVEHRDPLGHARRRVVARRREHDRRGRHGSAWCARRRRRGTPRGRSCANIPRGNGARWPRRSRSPDGRRPPPRPAPPGPAGARSPPSHGRGNCSS